MGYAHVSTGDILRKEKEMETELGLTAQKYSKKGLLVPDELLENLVERELTIHLKSQGIILDGYPRTIQQAKTLEFLCKKHGIQIQKVVLLNVEKNELIQRGIERGKTSDREDDKNPEVIKKRIEVYNEETKPVAEFYSLRTILAEVNGEGSMNEITERILKSV
ncbi:MAG: nucleoside monophosphate kinase [Cytophagaceae bacterium]|nr:nucleoside monophosphate kinase [Cytophagaceae bacterium]